MQQFACGQCGYDMTGIEQLSNGLEMSMYATFNGIMPMGISGFYNSAADNTVRCPNCGTVGHWIKH